MGVKFSSYGGDSTKVVERVGPAVQRLEHGADLDPLIERIGDARVVMLGEASHGTSDFYTWRAQISRRLIREKGFSFISVEGDWPDCYRVNRYVKAYPESGESAHEVLDAFERWPTWMWANWEIVALAEWMRKHNANHERKVGFYGLDVYSLWESLEAIIGYLDEYDPEAAKIARKAYLCFEPYGQDAEIYAWNTAMVPESCEEAVIDLLRELRERTQSYEEDTEGAFSAEQNALVTVNAEQYYRAMVRGGPGSWNVRDNHMMETLDRLLDFHGDDAKGIVWAHNTHVGDARYTDMADQGMVNIGQLGRQRYSEDQVVLVGFGTHRGTVIAGDAWGAPMERMPVPLAMEGSWEDILHRVPKENKLLLLDDLRDEQPLLNRRGHRAIGVVYHPPVERYGNYVPTVLPRRYDAFLFIDKSEALHPLHIDVDRGKPPETYPWGL